MTLDQAIESLNMYRHHGAPTGGFLCAVLENNLMEAMKRADESSRENLFLICCFIYNEMPIACYGSPEKVSNWIKTRACDARKL